jgi:hypothetical protein
LNFTRSLVNDQPFYDFETIDTGTIILNNTDGSLDAMRLWGWSGCEVHVYLGGPTFALGDYAKIFSGYTTGIDINDEQLTIHIRDGLALLDRTVWRPSYMVGLADNQALESLSGQMLPFCMGRCRSIEPVFVGIMNGAWAYQFHDGPVGFYDAAFHTVLADGLPLTFIDGLSPGAGQWCLDTSNGMIFVGGAMPISLRADVIGDNPPQAISEAALLVGTGSRSFPVILLETMQLGDVVRIQCLTDPSVWMTGTLNSIGLYPNILTVQVTAFAGNGTYSAWAVFAQAARDDHASLVFRLLSQRLLAQSSSSTTTLSLAGGVANLDIIDRNISFQPGCWVLVQEHNLPRQRWLLGVVLAWSADTRHLRVMVCRYNGSSSYANWTITKLGLESSLIDLASFDNLRTLQPGHAGIYSAQKIDTLRQTIDRLARSGGFWHSFSRAGQYRIARYGTAAAQADFSLGQDQVISLARQRSPAPAESIRIAYRQNWNPLSPNQLSPKLRSDLVANGGFATDQNWSKGDGWVISNGVASSNPGAMAELSQTISPAIGQTYQLSLIARMTSGSITLLLGGQVLGSVTTGSLYRTTFKAWSINTLLSFRKSADFAGSLDSVSITDLSPLVLQQKSRQVQADDSRVRLLNGPGASQIARQSFFDDLLNAQGEADYQLSLFSLGRDLFEVVVKGPASRADIGHFVMMKDHRFGLSSGKMFVVLATHEKADLEGIRLTLWG